jgi:cobalt/nickel transport system permease protein
MGNRIPAYLFQAPVAKPGATGIRKTNLSFLDKTLLSSAHALKAIYLQAENAGKTSVVHNIHPYIKLLSLIYLAVIISIAGRLHSQLLAASLILVFYVTARVRIYQVYRKIFLLAFLFGFLVVFPATLNVITPGKIILNLITLDSPRQFWIYHIPQHIGFTKEGFQVVSLIFLRVLNSISIAFLVIYTTSFPSLIKSFRIIGVPDTFLMVITLAYKFIYILSRTVEDTYFALKSRLLGNIRSSNLRKLVGGRIFFIFKRSMIIYENTYYAMVSRGYRGKVMLSAQNRLTSKDFMALLVIIASGMGIILIG